jgi:hypothetical protein
MMSDTGTTPGPVTARAHKQQQLTEDVTTQTQQNALSSSMSGVSIVRFAASVPSCPCAGSNVVEPALQQHANSNYISKFNCLLLLETCIAVKEESLPAVTSLV